jgi:Family of unknown function (DUF6263)
MLRSLLPTCRAAFPAARAGRFGTNRIEDQVMKSTRFEAFFPYVLASLVVTMGASPSRADTTLRWKFSAGQKRSYVLIQKTATKMEVMGKPVETSSTQTVDITWNVKGVDKDGNADMTQTIDRVRFEMTGPTGKVNLDTAKAEDAPAVLGSLANLFKAMTGSPFTMKFTARGQLRDVVVPAKIVDAFKNAGPAGAMFGDEETLKKMTSQSIVPFPEAAIAQGKSWNELKKMPMPFGTMVMDTTYTLEAAAGPVETIGVDVKLKIEPKAGSPLDITVKSQQVKGHYRFDNAVGYLKASELVQKLSMAVTVNGQEFAQDLNTTVKMELKNDSAAK